MIFTFRPFRNERCRRLPFLPDPELKENEDHYKPFSEMRGKKTKDVSFKEFHIMSYIISYVMHI